MAVLRPAFKPGGVVTAVNALSVNDGATAVILMSAAKAEELGVKPLLQLINVCSESVDPKMMGLGPTVVMLKCLEQAGLRFSDVDYWEINEAFAA